MVDVNLPVPFASVIKLGLASFASSLSIETLSDETIPIDRYRLKLQVVESSGLETAPKGNKKEIISTTQILDERTLRRGNEGKPNRILIRGRPGTGKSTLGRQILHQMEQKPWNQFQWVLWVPLDRFTREIDLTTFLGKVYFKERYDIAGGLLQRIFEGQDNTLLILDGWDEINGTSPDIMGQVQQLAQFKNVIFTSRPRFPEMSRIDLILDISGFDDYTISSYVEDHAIGNSGTVPSDIKSFLSKNKTVKETFRGPLLLDLLCSFWHTLKLDLPKDPEQGNPPTLTMLYQTMVTELWRKSMSNFIKPPYTREEALLLSRFYLNKEIEPESHCLSAMAMQLFERRETTMNRNDIDEIAERDDQKGKHKWLAPNVTRTSFLHNDEFNIGARYSFLHQTFQEFFAAQSLVGNLSTLGSYIQKYKYDPRFTMVFRFVAGLLQKSGRETQLEDFFTSVEAKPRDLLGPAHERLVMNCLMEIQPPYIAKIRKCFEDRMKDWLLFECRWTRSPQLVTDPSFPDHVRKAVLEDATVHQNDKIFILHAFDNKASISPAIQGLMDSWLEGNKIPPALQAALLQTYDGFPLSKKTLLAIQRLSEDKSPGHEALSFVANLVMVESEPPQTGDLENLLRRKGNTHEKHAAIAALRGPSRLSEETIDILLVHGLPLWGDPLIRETMLNVLYKQANLDHGTWEFIWRRENQRRLEDQVSNSNPSFSQGELEQLDRDLHDDDPETIFRAVHTLRKQSHLPSQIIFRLAELVDGDAPIVSATAAHVLEQMSSFSAMPQNVSLSSKTGMMMALDRSVLLKTLEILVRCLSREDGAVRCCAGRILVQQTFLPNKILVSIKDSLMSGDNDIKPYAALILVLQRAHLQPWMTEAVICQVETMEGSELVRLEQRVDLPDYIVRPIVSRLEDRRGYQYQFNAIRVLGRQQKLDSNALQAIAAKVNDKLFNYFKEAVASAIKQHIETAITAALMEESSYFFKNIYQVALVISLQEPLSWSFDDDQKFCENMIPNDSISAVRMHHFIGQASKALKMPKPL
ncbi:hypothetical protein N7463_009691 [Penicillium fimorum]|uniref:AAA+ ATPase domain-containing protein n=1 Tax=Penicillium fimorum TaxID=1882269 RepID=A0A9W9XIM8_9EURO|nr:hypothetical protein N7463_009691 [Penicillium fimorum]